MLVKDKFLKKINSLIFVFIFLFSSSIFAESLKSSLIKYNKSLKDSLAYFIQTNGESVEEGVVYIGSKRIRIDYVVPNKITIILAEKKGMYINHLLEEVQYFDTRKTYIKFFISMIIDESFYNHLETATANNTIIVKDSFSVDNVFYNVEIIYENEPIKLRKIKILSNGNTTEMGLFDHRNDEQTDKKFFSMANPYLRSSK